MDSKTSPDAVTEHRTEAPESPDSETEALQPRQHAHLLSMARWRISVPVVLLLLLSTLFAHRYLADTAPPPLQIVFREGAVTLPERDAIRLLTQLEEDFLAQEQHLVEQLDEWQEKSIATLRHSFEAASTGFLDWYFSPTGSYTRLGATLLGGIDDLLEEQITARLTGPADLENRWNAIMAEHQAVASLVQQEWLTSTLSDHYHRFAQAAKTGEEPLSDPDYPVLNLSLATESAWENYSDSSRWRISASALAAPALVRLIGPRLLRSGAVRTALTGLRTLTARLGGHFARSAAAGGATGAATGLFAPVTGVAVFAGSIAVSVGTEYVLLKHDENQHRPGMEDELDRIWAEVEQSLRSQFQENIRTRVAELQHQLQLASEHQAAGLPADYLPLKRGPTQPHSRTPSGAALPSIP